MSEYIKREDAMNLSIEVTGARGQESLIKDLIQAVENHLKSVPSADVVEVRHGHWINDIGYAGWTCSECGDHEGNKTDKYCPHCGAKMDGKEQEHE